MDFRNFIESKTHDYKTALQLYKKYRKDNTKDVFFNSVADAQPGSLHHNLIMHELKNIWRKLPDDVKYAPKIAPAKTFRSPITAEKQTFQQGKFYNSEMLDVKTLPDDVQKLYFRNQEITKEMARMHIEIQDAKENEGRQKLAVALDALNKEREGNWEIINQHRKSPATKTEKAEPDASEEKPDTSKLTPAKILETKRRIDTIKISIKKNETELESGKLTDNKVMAKKTRIKAWKEELEALQKIMDSVTAE